MNSMETQPGTMISGIAYFDHRTDNEPKYREQTFDEFAASITHEAGEKDGLAISAGLFSGARTTENALARNAAIFDIEMNKRTGAVPMSPEEMADVLRAKGWRSIIYTSYNHTPELPRYRVAIALDHTVFFSTEPEARAADLELDLYAMRLIVNRLEIGDVVDETKLGVASIFYLARCPEDRLAQAQVINVPGKPIRLEPLMKKAAELRDADVARRKTIAQRAQEELAARMGNAAPTEGGKPIEKLRQVMPKLTEALTASGYTYYKKMDRWLHPESTTGIPGIVVFDGYDGYERLISFHGCDSLHHTAKAFNSSIHDVVDFEIARRWGTSEDAMRTGIRELCREYRITSDQPTSVRNADDFSEEREGVDFKEARPVLSVARPGEDEANRALICNAKGNPIWCMANALITLRYNEEWLDVLAYNEFTGRSILLKPIPGTTAVNSTFPRDIRDGDYTATTAWFNHNGFPTASKQVAADALEMAAQDAIMHPVRNYLAGLAWDGKPRLKTWLQVYCGAEVNSEEHAVYVQEAGFRWAISAVARIFRPGCKADAAIILEGRQGCGKSRGLKALAGDAFFGDSLPPMTSKDASTYLRGMWIIELAELSNINKAEVEHIKAFITRTEERFRPPYGRNEIAFPRQCVFAGTTNRDDYLRDDTGNRRFWPVTVTEVDVEAIEEDRDQIWAEAVHHFKAGEQWHMSVEAIGLAHDEQAERQADDPWADAIANFVHGRKSVSPSMIAIECLGIDIGRVNRADQNRIVSILRQMGWRKAGRITAGREYKGQFRYERGDA